MPRLMSREWVSIVIRFITLVRVRARVRVRVRVRVRAGVGLRVGLRVGVGRSPS